MDAVSAAAGSEPTFIESVKGDYRAFYSAHAMMRIGLATLPAISRIRHGRHFFSQAALGWYLGYEAVRATDHARRERLSWLIGPVGGGWAITAAGIF